MSSRQTADVIVIGAGLIGAACALALAEAGLDVCVVDRRGPAGGTSAAGEGNVLVSDKVPGPELALALRSRRLWDGLARRLPDQFELEAKGGLVVGRTEEEMAGIASLAGQQAAMGVEVERLCPEALAQTEPLLAQDLAGAAHYPQDACLQPMLATASLLAAAARAGCRSIFGVEAGPGTARSGATMTISTSEGAMSAGAVVNATGPWSGEVARYLGSELPVRPRRGSILVTEPLPLAVRHKVYEGDYVAAVIDDAGVLACSAVVEATRSGTLLIGSSRQFVGFDSTPDVGLLGELARRAVRLFPFLSRVRALRTYSGFRPASPDHLPIIGADPSVPGLWHATGHEGAGVGLAPATAEMIAALVTGSPPSIDPRPFAPSRFATDHGALPGG
jgi:glycine/D-amino acid oxidase-like deaminating enzyme